MTYLNLALRGMIRYLYNVSVQDACFGGFICQYKYTPKDDCKKINSLPAIVAADVLFFKNYSWCLNEVQHIPNLDTNCLTHSW